MLNVLKNEHEFSFTVNRVADGADAVLQNAANQQNEENADIAQASKDEDLNC